jgi:MFS family permease
VGLISSIVIIFITEFVVKEPAIIGSVMMIAGLAGLALAYPIASIADKKLGKKNIAIFSMMLRTIGFFILPFVRDVISLFLVMALQNISFNTGMPSIRAIQADLTHRAIRGRVFGQQQTFFNLGMGIGALVGAALYIQYAHISVYSLPGVSVLFFFSAFLSLINAFLIKKYVIG